MPNSQWSNPSHPPETALVVNSSAKQRQNLTAILANADYHVLTSATAEEAIDVCRNFHGAIQLLVTDLNLPGESGWQLAEAAAKVRPGIVVLFLSTDDDSGLKRLGELAATLPESSGAATLLKFASSLSGKAQLSGRHS